MKILLQENIMSELSQDKLLTFIKELKHTSITGYRVVKDLPFHGSDHTKLFSKDEMVFPFGSINFLKNLQVGVSYKLRHFCDWNRFKCSVYYHEYGSHILNDDYTIVQVNELTIENLEKFSEMYNEDGCIFIRPNLSDKQFAGQIIDIKDFYKMLEILVFYNHLIKRDDFIVVSRPIKIYDEYRFVISRNKIITYSSYRVNEKLDYTKQPDEEIFRFVENMVSRNWKPHTMYVLDIATTPDGPKIAEVGSINVAGLYNCDASKIIFELVELEIEGLLWI